MSFVSIVLQNDFISIMADCRVSEIFVDGSFYQAVSEDFNKINIITDNVFLAIMGENEEAQDFISKSKLYETVINENLLEDYDVINNWFNSSINTFVYDYHFTLLLGGKNIKNELLFYIAKSKYKSLNEVKITQNGDMRYFVSGLTAEKLFRELYEKCNGTIENILNIQKTVNDFIADNNVFVNKKTNYFVINKYTNASIQGSM